jgi:hypothetical protein
MDANCKDCESLFCAVFGGNEKLSTTTKSAANSISEILLNGNIIDGLSSRFRLLKLSTASNAASCRVGKKPTQAAAIAGGSRG